MLVNCAGARAGEHLLILYEPAELGIYGPGLAEATAEAASELGLTVSEREVGVLDKADQLPPGIARALTQADHAVFFARLGDQLRFKAMPDGARPIVSYALDEAMLGSSFGRTDHRAMVALKEAIDRALKRARDIRVTCPLGTDMRGSVDPTRGTEGACTTVQRFPLSVFTPLAAADFSGRIALARFLMGTGSHYYQPYGLPLEDVSFAAIGGGRILDFSGRTEEVARIRRHYAHVSDLLGVDAGVVHSWHAGIHPGCRYDTRVSASYERWSSGAFGNPRILHFHTCGDYAPGEICWNVIDPTITVDGVALWEDGVLRPDRVAGGADILAQFPEAAAIFGSPIREIGL